MVSSPTMREPCSERPGLKKGPWTPEEDHKLITYIQSHGHSSWRVLPREAGLARCGKSCRLRWTNYLRPGIKRGNFSQQEENTIIQLHAALGNRWSTISTHLPGRTDNEIKNHWNTRLRKRLLKMGVDPTTHRPTLPPPPPHLHRPLPPPPFCNTSLLLSLLQGVNPPCTPDLASSLLTALLPGSNSSVSSSIALFPAAPGYVVQNNGGAPAAAAPLSSSPGALDPALLAAAETRLVLDCLKLTNGGHPAHSSTSSDHLQLDHILNRILLLRLLQNSRVTAPAPLGGAAAACYDSPNVSKAPFGSLLSAEQILQNLGLRAAAGGAASMPPAGAAAAPSCAQLSAYAHPNPHAPALKSNGVSPSAMLSGMCSNSYQQRLLQTLPFLAESVMETSTSGAATDHLSCTTSHRISQEALLRCPPRDHMASAHQPGGSFPSPQTWSGMEGGGDHHQVRTRNTAAPAAFTQKQTQVEESDQLEPTSGTQPVVQAGGCLMQNDEHRGLMASEEHLMSERKGSDRDLASSSTVSSSTHSSGSQHPSVLAQSNFNTQDYWSDLLSLIGSSK